MQTDKTESLLHIARSIVAKVPYCMAITATEAGDANARIVEPYSLSEHWSVRFLTGRQCRKVQEMQHTGRMTLSYQCDEDHAYVTLLGQAKVLDHDPALKSTLWRKNSDLWFPGGPFDPDVVVIELRVEQIELWCLKLGVAPPPVGLQAAILKRDGAEWITVVG
ncbi:pyridoxamine 5'-phosphate oxidase family protein [Pseudomonas sp. 6D_7.1_Bac1]|uniref:pyridoxamine 5'-phosphate oxidase family protein n=1 Tax=Pseudomonas sp. 6D_7.1_Bac1 TaxID=2971615 RepID=UPI0021C9E07D|nr:pyridoxamine 5'-phosphate oxidase family protein [Pseudomonas sp. 6D_7.1_Bac1]MCU1752814.1 pyridoxamine 5'-phosphate oxidase family protein [Pseudomonas sp. 6D_7.1_Bac1]